ncbi:hypothetical protein ACFL35_15560 [Candidatus Riflebacteria bacterium]
MPKFREDNLTVAELCDEFGFSRNWFNNKVRKLLNCIKAGKKRYNIHDVREVLNRLSSLKNEEKEQEIPCSIETSESNSSLRMALNKIIKESNDD